MFSAKGYYRTTWTGSAARNLTRQVPDIEPGWPAIREYYPATINIRFEPKIIVAGWDHRTPPVRWTGDSNGEVFDLVRVRLSFPALLETVPALLYVAHCSDHRNDPHKHEFLADRFVNGLKENMCVVLECDRNSAELPYTSAQPGGNGKPRRARTIVIL